MTNQKTKEDVAYKNPIKAKLVSLPRTLNKKLKELVCENFLFRKNPIEMLRTMMDEKKVIDFKTPFATKINITDKKDIRINKLNINELMNKQSDSINEIVNEKKEVIKNNIFKSYTENTMLNFNELMKKRFNSINELINKNKEINRNNAFKIDFRINTLIVNDFTKKQSDFINEVINEIYEKYEKKEEIKSNALIKWEQNNNNK